MTDFRQKVYAVVKKIPRGQTLTYKQVAEKIKPGNIRLQTRARPSGTALFKKITLYNRAILLYNNNR